MRSRVSALFLLLAAAPAAAITGEEIIARMQERLEEYKTFSARFEKQFYWAVLDKTRSREGRLYIRRPDRFRVEVEDGDVVVADGRAVWAYIPKNKQVVVSAYTGDVKTPWEVLVDYSEGYEPIAVDESEAEGQSCYRVVLRPRGADASAERMKVWIDRKRWLPLRIEQVEANDNITTYILKDHRTNKKIDDEVFRFAVPEGVEVIDQRETGARGG